MAAADQGSSSAVPPSLIRRQPSGSGSRDGHAEPTHHHKLSESSSFSTAPAASPSSSSPPLSSCESPAAGELDRRSSSSSTSSYESFYQIDSSSSSFHDFVDPSTEAPAVQAMTASGYDPKRLPSSMFRTQPTCAGQWSATSNESLFSIQLPEAAGAAGGAVYGDLYYDAAGVFHRLSSAGRDPAWKLPAAAAEAEAPPGVPGGGLCVKDDCARCGSMTRKPVRFANAAGSVAGSAKHVPTLPAAMEEEPEEAAPAAAESGAAAEGWSLFGGWCCPSMWWPSCACWGCDSCRC